MKKKLLFALGISIFSLVARAQTVDLTNTILTLTNKVGNTCSYTFTADATVAAAGGQPKLMTVTIGASNFCWVKGAGTSLVAAPCAAGATFPNGAGLPITTSFDLACDGGTTYSVALTTGTATTTALALAATTGANSPAPVKLNYFTAQSGKSSNLINWASASETGFDKFYIQKSTDAKVFENIGIIESKGSGSYSFEDNNPILGQNYYRLKMQDLDGSLEFSKIVSVNFITETLMEIYPNPAVQNQIVLNGAYDFQGIKLTTTSGQALPFQIKKEGSKTILLTDNTNNSKEIIVSAQINNRQISKRVILQ